MSTYETTFIVPSDADSAALDAIVEKVKKILSKNGSHVTLLENEGVKKFAYPVNSRLEGYYVYAEYTAPPEVLEELENFLRLNDSVLRHLSVAKDKPRKVKPKKPRKNKPEPVSDRRSDAAASPAPGRE